MLHVFMSSSIPFPLHLCLKILRNDHTVKIREISTNVENGMFKNFIQEEGALQGTRATLSADGTEFLLNLMLEIPDQIEMKH